MLNYLWTGMLLVGFFVGAVTGHMGDISNAIVDSAQEAVELCLTMLGVMVMWTGVMRIAQVSGLLEKLTRLLRPALRFLFPNIPEEHPAGGYIATNCVANILGLGWAATPAGLKAMEALAELEAERRKEGAEKTEADVICKGWEKKKEPADMAQSSEVQSGVAQGSAAHKKNGRCRWERGGMPPSIASNEMCTFLILNISSLQLIPVNIIAYRSQYASANPTVIVGPAILATAVSTGVAVAFCKVMDYKKRRV